MPGFSEQAGPPLNRIRRGKRARGRDRASLPPFPASARLWTCWTASRASAFGRGLIGGCDERLPGSGAERRLPSAQLLPALSVVLAGYRQGGFPGARQHHLGIRARGALAGLFDAPAERDRAQAVHSDVAAARPSRGSTCSCATGSNASIAAGRRERRNSPSIMSFRVRRGGRTSWVNVVERVHRVQPAQGQPAAQGNAGCTRGGRRSSRPTRCCNTHGRAFPPNYLHDSWRDFLYWDSELEAE